MRPSAYYAAGFEDERHPPHFLDSCSLCRRPIGENSDIYMYRGDKPFCSQECRQEQIEMDEADERKMKLAAKRALRQNKESTKESETNKAVRRGTVAVA